MKDILGNLPQLTGTEKQIKWAETIREEFCNSWDFDKPRYRNTIETFFNRHTASSFWIENRYEIKSENWMQFQMSQTRNELVLEPINFKGVIKITYINCHGFGDDTISIKYKTDDTFRSIMKEHGFKWNSEGCSWDKNTMKEKGEERLFEVCKNLLNNGYALDMIQIPENGDINSEYESFSGSFKKELKSLLEKN